MSRRTRTMIHTRRLLVPQRVKHKQIHKTLDLRQRQDVVKEHYDKTSKDLASCRSREPNGTKNCEKLMYLPDPT
jgi:hypothetical protein